jgi:pSer/pThr/pTyr-binding forkhead associated (FHA) protein
MRLLLRQKDGSSKEFQFVNGPVSIGRATNNQVFLPDRGVSRQHAILHCDGDGKWMVEDKGSSNKTYLNDMAITKAEIKHGDCLRIIDFTLEFILEDQAEEAAAMANLPEDTLHLEAALTTPKHETVVRKPDAQHAPAMRLAARRLSDFSSATEKIFMAGSIDEMLLTILDIAMDQFSAYHVWSALRTQPAGPMTSHAGKRRDGQPIQLNQLQLSEKIIQAVEKGQFLVLPRVSAQLESKDRIRSAMIATIIRPNGCYGVIYVDNAMINEHYSLSDLDYLMLIAMHTASVLNKFLD